MTQNTWNTKIKLLLLHGILNTFSYYYSSGKMYFMDYNRNFLLLL